jgi:hypothetical protein
MISSMYFQYARLISLCTSLGVMVFCFVQNFVFWQHQLEYLFFLSRKARNFFQEFNIRLYDKNSESNYFFFLHQNQNIFFSNAIPFSVMFRSCIVGYDVLVILHRFRKAVFVNSDFSENADWNWLFAVNYRPVSLTCICCKIMEHLVTSHIMKHADANNTHICIFPCLVGHRYHRTVWR